MRTYNSIGRKQTKEQVEAFKEMVTITTLFVDAHINWIKDHPTDPNMAQVHRQMLNFITILKPAFPLITNLFPSITLDSLQTYINLYNTGVATGDIPSLEKK